MHSGSDLIVSVSGVRGIIGESLTPEVALRFANAFASTRQAKKLVLSRDGRPSGDMLRHAVLAGLLSSSCDVHDIGIAPTPTFGLAITRLQADGGMQITASHNPAPWNGLKLFDHEGKVLDAATGQQVRHAYEHSSSRRASWPDLGRLSQCDSAHDWHCDRILELVDVAHVRSANFRVFVDANGGAGGPLARKLLEALGCRVTCQACDADGQFLHEPEPIAANLVDICPLVPAHRSEERRGGKEGRA